MHRIAFAGLLALLAVGCAPKQRPVVVLAGPERGDRQWDAIHGGAAKAAEELGFSLERVSEVDRARQVAGVVAADNVTPPEGAAVVRIGETEQTSNAPVQVVSDAAEGGRAAAVRLAELLESTGEVAAIGARGDPRTTSFVQELKRFPGLRVAAVVGEAPDHANTAAMIARLLKAHPGVRGLFVASEPASVATVAAYQAQGETRIRTVGMGSRPELMGALQDRTLDGLVAADPFRMGYEAVRAVSRMVRGEQPPRVVRIPEVLVTRENMERPEIIEIVQPDVQKWLSPRRRR